MQTTYHCGFPLPPVPLQVLFTPGVGPGLVDRMAAWIKGHAAGRGVAARGADVATGAGAGVASKL